MSLLGALEGCSEFFGGDIPITRWGNLPTGGCGFDIWDGLTNENFWVNVIRLDGEDFIKDINGGLIPMPVKQDILSRFGERKRTAHILIHLFPNGYKITNNGPVIDKDQHEIKMNKHFGHNNIQPIAVVRPIIREIGGWRDEYGIEREGEFRREGERRAVRQDVRDVRQDVRDVRQDVRFIENLGGKIKKSKKTRKTKKSRKVKKTRKTKKSRKQKKTRKSKN